MTYKVFILEDGDTVCVPSQLRVSFRNYSSFSFWWFVTHSWLFSSYDAIISTQLNPLQISPFQDSGLQTLAMWSPQTQNSFFSTQGLTQRP